VEENSRMIGEQMKRKKNEIEKYSEKNYSVTFL
jgi:glutathione peroxidase-family protein